MVQLEKIFRDRSAKTKKVMQIIFGVIIAIAVFVFIFIDIGAMVGIVISAAIIAAISVGVFFWLKAIDDLPDPF